MEALKKYREFQRRRKMAIIANDTMTLDKAEQELRHNALLERLCAEDDDRLEKEKSLRYNLVARRSRMFNALKASDFNSEIYGLSVVEALINITEAIRKIDENNKQFKANS